MPIAIKDNEIIGRRLFGTQGWKVSDAAFTVELAHFYDTRLDLDLSVDRLGMGNVENNRAQKLTELADGEAAERRPSTTFEGWAGIMARDLTFPGWNKEVYPVDDPKGKNSHHAEIKRDNFRQKAQAYTFATVMADRFSRRGRFVPPHRSQMSTRALPQ